MKHRVVRLGQVTDINPTTKAAGSAEDLVSFLAMSDISEEGRVASVQQRRLADVQKGYTAFQAGDVLLAKITPCFENGKAALVESLPTQIGFGSTEFHVLRPTKDVDPKFLFHLVWNPNFRRLGASRMTGSAGQKRVPAAFLADYEFSLPPLHEQQRVATILDKADSLRRKRQTAIRLTNEFLRAVFSEMFGDPDSNPKNFEAGTIRDLVASANYGTSEKASEEIGKYAILRMNNITYQGGWDLSSLKYVDLDPATAHKYLAQRGDLLFNRTNSKELVGKTAVYMRDEPMAIAGYLVRVRMNERGNPHYVSGYLNSTHGKQTLASRAKSIVGMANINAQEMQDIPLLLPPKALQDKFGRVVEEVARRASKHHVFAQQADQLQVALANQFFCTEPASA
jgi:type I restriction enzyme S subunit